MGPEPVEVGLCRTVCETLAMGLALGLMEGLGCGLAFKVAPGCNAELEAKLDTTEADWTLGMLAWTAFGVENTARFVF